MSASHIETTAFDRAASAAAPAVPLRNWLAVFGSTLGAFMAVLNIQIVNASLADRGFVSLTFKTTF